MSTKQRGVVPALLTGLALFLLPGPALAQDPKDLPFDALTDWYYYNNAGWRALNRGNLERAAQAFRMAIQVLRPCEAQQRELMARSNADFARVLYFQKRYDEAEPLARWALAVREAEPGDRSESLTQNLVLLAQIRRAQSQPADSQTLLERAVAVQEKSLGAGHSDEAATLEELAAAYADQRKLDQAARSYGHALAIREAHSTENLKKAAAIELRQNVLNDVRYGYSGMGSIFGFNSTMNQAERLAMQAWKAEEASTESVTAAAATERYATVLRQVGRKDEADSMESKARAMRDAAETRAARAGQP
jgi:tetratricopeptide (TPR) repeat protein